MSNKILKRSEVPVENTWNLADMFESDDAWLAEYEALKALPAKIVEYQGKLGESAQNLLAFLKLEDEIELRLTPLYGYASCKGDEDTANGFYQDLRGKAMSTYVAISGAASFAIPEIMTIPEEALEEFYKAEPELETYRRSLYRIRRKAAHVLTPECEMLLANAGEVADAPDNIGSILRNADMRFPSVTDSEGNEHQLTGGTLVPLLESSDRVLRKNTFEAFYNRLGEFKNTIAATLDAQFKQLRFFATARKYNSTLEA